MLLERHKLESSLWDIEYAKSKNETEKVDSDYVNYFSSDPRLKIITDFLGDIRNKKVLDYGCGTGWVSVILANSGAKVFSIDVSDVGLHILANRVKVNECEQNITIQKMSCEQLSYKDQSFDIILGWAILHHLNLPTAIEEIRRVLKPHGKGVFIEPLHNPLLWLARKFLPYAHKGKHGTDAPLTYKDIDIIGRRFSSSMYYEYELLTGLLRFFGRYKSKILFRIDEIIMRFCPFLRKYCRIVILLLQK